MFSDEQHVSCFARLLADRMQDKRATPSASVFELRPDSLLFSTCTCTACFEQHSGKKKYDRPFV